MMVLRYELRVGANELELPESAGLVHVGAKDGDLPDRLQLWACVSDGHATEPRERVPFYVAATGESAHGLYVGTAVVLGGRLVWHVFDQRKA